mmetsp:Transcript_65202/g.117344  ORF Transcript_65202/g.117344 Transcript_65202/m.117344 type:complete len:408 (-) Transcript_65202:888-2111(-)
MAKAPGYQQGGVVAAQAGTCPPPPSLEDGEEEAPGESRSCHLAGPQARLGISHARQSPGRSMLCQHLPDKICLCPQPLLAPHRRLPEHQAAPASSASGRFLGAISADSPLPAAPGLAQPGWQASCKQLPGHSGLEAPPPGADAPAPECPPPKLPQAQLQPPRRQKLGESAAELGQQNLPTPLVEDVLEAGHHESADAANVLNLLLSQELLPHVEQLPECLAAQGAQRGAEAPKCLAAAAPAAEAQRSQVPGPKLRRMGRGAPLKSPGPHMQMPMPEAVKLLQVSPRIPAFNRQMPELHAASRARRPSLTDPTEQPRAGPAARRLRALPQVMKQLLPASPATQPKTLQVLPPQLSGSALRDREANVGSKPLESASQATLPEEEPGESHHEGRLALMLPPSSQGLKGGL